MVSYKKLFEDLKKKIEEERKMNMEPNSTGFLCPLCEKYEIVQIGSEFVCSNEDCLYDKIDSEVFNAFAKLRHYERID